MTQAIGVTTRTAAAPAIGAAAFAPVAGRPAIHAGGLRIDRIGDEDGFAALEADWRALEARAPHSEYFSSFDWAWCWWDHFGRAGTSAPALVTARRSGRLVAVMPLAIVTAGPYSFAVMMGAGTGQYGDILVDRALTDRDALFAALWRGIAALGVDAIQADNVRGDSALAALLAPRRKWAGAAEPSYEVVTGDFAGFEAYMATRTGRQRKDLRRRRRRLAEEGEARYEVVTGPEEIGDVAARAIALKREWLAERGLHGRFVGRPNVDAWMADVARRAHARGRLHLSVFRVGDRLVAAQVAFLSDTRLVAYFGAFDVAWSRLSVGKLHLEDHLAEMFPTGRTIDLLPPGDDYKIEWATPGVAARSYLVPLSLGGWIASVVHNPRQRARLKRAYLAVPRAWRARLAAGALALAAAVGRAVSGRPPASPRHPGNE